MRSVGIILFLLMNIQSQVAPVPDKRLGYGSFQGNAIVRARKEIDLVSRGQGTRTTKSVPWSIP